LSEGFPPPAGIAEEPVYGFERSVQATVSLWCELIDGTSSDIKEELSTQLEFGRKIVEAAPLGEFFDVLGQSEDSSLHLPLAYALRTLAYTHKELAPKVWELLQNDNRWRSVLTNTSPEAIVLLFEAFAEFQAQAGGQWISHLPRLYAQMAETNAAATEQAQLFFGLTLFASIHSDTVGALERLLHGPERGTFAPFASGWRSSLRSTLPRLIPWVAGRVRGVLGSLWIE
jgi:hypothetical protein